MTSNMAGAMNVRQQMNFMGTNIGVNPYTMMNMSNMGYSTSYPNTRPNPF